MKNTVLFWRRWACAIQATNGCESSCICRPSPTEKWCRERKPSTEGIDSTITESAVELFLGLSCERTFRHFPLLFCSTNVLLCIMRQFCAPTGILSKKWIQGPIFATKNELKACPRPSIERGDRPPKTAMEIRQTRRETWPLLWSFLSCTYIEQLFLVYCWQFLVFNVSLSCIWAPVQS